MKRIKAISPLISAILLIVVAVILVTIVLSWGKEFTNKSLNKTQSIFEIIGPSDKQPFIRFVEAQNGMYVFDYYPPNQTDINFTVVGYSLIGYNDYIPLEPEYNFNRPGKHYIPLGIIDEEKITIGLLLDNGSYLTFRNVTNKNQSPSLNDCPVGYIPVPGNHLYGTVGPKGGFCVSKYELKLDRNADGIGDFAVDYGCQFSTFNLWRYNFSDCDIGEIVSSASGSPIVFTGLANAVNACNSLGENYHLMNNNEWMTIARNIEVIPNNWYNPDTNNWGVSFNDVGKGNKLPQGQKTVDPNYCLSGSLNDNEGYFGINNPNNSHRRTFFLTNGEVIWDLSGNVFEFINIVIYKKDLPDLFNFDGSMYDNSVMLTGDYAFNSSNKYANYLDLGNTTLKYKDLYLLGNKYTRENGNVGYLYTLSNRTSTDVTEVVFIRGGHWADTSSCGLLALLTNRTYVGTDVAGARCVYVPN